MVYGFIRESRLLFRVIHGIDEKYVLSGVLSRLEMVLQGAIVAEQILVDSMRVFLKIKKNQRSIFLGREFFSKFVA